MTAPEARPGGLDSNARGLLVLVVALIVGVLLLANAGAGGSGDQKVSSTPNTTAPLGSSDTTDDTTADTSATTAPESDRQPSEVSVIVLNGSGQAGAAGTTSDTVGQAGYTMLEADNAPANIDATTVFYATDYQTEATAIALLLGKSTDTVKPLSEAQLGGAEGDANVVVVLGADTPPTSGATTTTAAN